ncbi:hypothetical protein EVAR_61821_1 [Eumeta japonica]|uniref:Uncharacterized protein n=1 Tax=Eumeta variegata TaxID=151549 RepID=A0A4C1YSY5_EUMVA|nr:hypothetical protein EVAR_61821_1 [Eumeta japonica]
MCRSWRRDLLQRVSDGGAADRRGPPRADICIRRGRPPRVKCSRLGNHALLVYTRDRTTVRQQRGGRGRADRATRTADVIGNKMKFRRDLCGRPNARINALIYAECRQSASAHAPFRGHAVFADEAGPIATCGDRKSIHRSAPLPKRLDKGDAFQI